MGKSNRQPTIDQRHLPYMLDEGIGHRARIGIIALPDDLTIEHELRMLFDLPGVTCFVNRLPCAATITPANLKAMEGEIARAARLILPELSVDTVFISCTNLRALSIFEELEDELGKSRWPCVKGQCRPLLKAYPSMKYLWRQLPPERAKQRSFSAMENPNDYSHR